MIKLIKLNICALLLAFSANLFASNNIEVSAKLVDSATDGVYIDFEFKNKSNKNIKIVSDDLPWMDPSSLIIKAIQSDGVDVDERLPIADINIDDLTELQAGKSITGKVYLAKRIPNFESARKNKDIIVFWTYEVGPSIRSLFDNEPRFGGWFSLSKTGQK